MRRPDAEIFRENVLQYKPKGMRIWEVEEAAGYARNHLNSIKFQRCDITAEHTRNYAKVLGIEPMKLLKGMFDD